MPQAHWARLAALAWLVPHPHIQGETYSLNTYAGKMYSNCTT